MKRLTLLLLLILTTALGTIEAHAAWHTNEMGIVYDDLVWRGPTLITNNIPIANHKPRTFTVTCYHCGKLQRGLTPIFIKPESVTAGTDGTNIITRTVILSCRDCCGSIIAKTVKLVPIPIAIEDEPVASGAGGSATQTWTTDPNLRLTVQLTNCPAPIFGLTSTQFPAQGLVGYPNGVLVTQAMTGTLPVFCGKTAVISFPTEIGKVYKCQVSGDNRAPGDPMKVWIDGLPIAGTGGIVVQAQLEVADKPVRVYRVLESPL